MNHFSQRRSKMTLLLSICFSLISSFGFTQLTVTKTYSPGSSISIDGCGTYCTTLPGVTFSSADFSPGACEITDVNVNIVWAKTDGSCTSPGVGSSFHSETNFRIDGPDGVNEILVLPGSYSGNGTISSVSTTLDQSAGSTIGGVDPFSGTFRPNNGNLDNFNGTNAFGTWALRAGDTGAGDPLCIVSYSVTVTLSASDVSAPVPDLATLSDITAECEVTSLTAPTATDNCGVVTVTNDVTLPITTQGTTVVTWTYDDGNGNTSTQTQNVIITDATAPVADIATLSDITAECEVTSLTAPTATDNCGVVTVTNDATLPVSSQGTTVVTWTYDDGNGNTSTQTQNVVITDVSAPVADVSSLSDITAECEVTSLTAPTATDNCGGTVTVTNDATLPITTQGTTVVTWTYDDGNGNTSTQTQNVVITDATAPVADIATLSDITAECEVTSLTAPTATDNCGGTVTVTNDATLPITTQGTTVVTWTYDDGNGNTSTQTQNVILTDAIAPTASNPTALSFECLADAVVDISVVTDEADNCLGPITVSHVSDVVTGNGCQDTITRTYNVADESGNNIDVVQMIYIEDVTAPTASNPTTLNVQCAADIPAPVTGWVTDEADNCGVPTVTWVNDVSDGLTCPETITRTFAVTDNCGNSINVIQLVVVQDIDAPIFDVASLVTETAFCDVTLTPPTATDNCSGVITATTTQVFPINTLGTTTVTWNYVDDCGNTSSQTQDVVIESIDVSTYIANDGISIVSSNVTAGVTYQWIDCSAGNTPLVGETNHNFTPTYSSDFAVIITEDGCSDTSACVTVTEVGLTDLSAGTLTFSPNPTIDGNFKINYDGQIKSIEVVDLIGRSVRLPIDLNEGLVNGSQLSAGKYLVRVVTIENQEMIGTIIIQK